MTQPPSNFTAGRISLDALSGCPLHPEIIEAMLPYLGVRAGRTTALHRRGIEARKAVELARHQVASLLGTKHPEEVVFTSNGTESIQWAIRSLVDAARGGTPEVVSSGLEPSAARSILNHLRSEGMLSIIETQPLTSGHLDPDRIASVLNDKTAMVMTHAVQQELGSIQPVSQITALATAKGVPCVMDLDGALGWETIRVDELGLVVAAGSADRFGGPQGIGILWRHRQLPLKPWLVGGEHANGLRAGVENLPGIVGTGMATELAQKRQHERRLLVALNQVAFLQRLRTAVPGVRLFGPEPEQGRAVYNLCFGIEGVEAEALVLFCDLRGLEMHAGAACQTGKQQTPVSLETLGVSPQEGRTAILITFSEPMEEKVLERAVWILAQGVQRIRELMPD